MARNHPEHLLETELQFNISKNGIITLHRGDTFTVPICINLGTGCEPEYYSLQEGDKLYFAVLEPKQPWEFALIRKMLTYEDTLPDHYVAIHFSTEDTEYLLPGNYYYEVKLYRDAQNTLDGFEHVDTIVPRRKFIILE